MFSFEFKHIADDDDDDDVYDDDYGDDVNQSMVWLISTNSICQKGSEEKRRKSHYTTVWSGRYGYRATDAYERRALEVCRGVDYTLLAEYMQVTFIMFMWTNRK